jgi:hypothetical protein
MHCAFRLDSIRFRGFALHLKSNLAAKWKRFNHDDAQKGNFLHNLERIRENLSRLSITDIQGRENDFTYNLATACASTCDQLPDKLYATGFRIHRARSDEIIYGQLDSFLRGYTLG